MSDYRINAGDIMGPEETEKIMNMLGILDEDDELTITMDLQDSEQAEGLLRMLDDNEFDVSARGDHENNIYHITAKRRVN